MLTIKNAQASLMITLLSLAISARPTDADTTPTILEIQALFGPGGYRNPAFDTSSRDWAVKVCGGNTWLKGYNPRYEWTPVLPPRNELEDEDVAISGTAIGSHRSTADVWFTHPFGNDLNFNIAPDPEYANLPSPILRNDSEDPYGTVNSIQKAKTEYGLDVTNVLHVEMDEGFVPRGFEVNDGDRVAVLGRWIVDCGHPDYGAEVHPPLLYLCARPNGPNATHVSIISRPFLVSQEFGDGGLYEHLVKQLLLVYPPLLPFPVTSQVEARPKIIQQPFSGLKLINFVIRPPTPRQYPNDKLLVSYELTVRSGVAVQLYSINDDAVGILVVMNDVAYNPAPLPPKQNRNISKQEIQMARPDIGDLIFHLQGIGSVLANPGGAIVLEKGVDTDFYQIPTWVGPPPLRSLVSQLSTVRIQPDDGPPWPIRGHLDVQWQRLSHPAIPFPNPTQ
jgi:hypothetical protein